MEYLLQYLSDKTMAFLIGTISASFSFGIVNAALFIGLRKKIKIRQVFLVTICMVLVLVLPQFTLDYLISYPKMLININPILATILSLPNPVSVFLYYFLFRKILVSHANMFLILESAFLGQYITLTMYTGMKELWGSILSVPTEWPQSFDSHILSMITANIIVLGAIFFFYRHLRQGKYLEIPYGYPIPDRGKTLLTTFLSVSCNYIVLVTIRICMLINRSIDPYILFAAFYLIITAILIYRLYEMIQHRRLNIIEWQARATDEYIRSLISVNEDFRSLKHDFYNILQVYGGFIATQDLNGLSQYHNSTVKTTTRIGTSLDIIDSLRSRKALYTLFELKAQLAKEYDVDMKIISPSTLINVAMNDLDLCRIMANLIDNAIEAAAESDDKKVIVECAPIGKAMMSLVISNSTAEAVDMDQLGQGSTKPNHMGHGLTTVRNIIAIRDGCSLSLAFEESMFIARVFLVTNS